MLRPSMRCIGWHVMLAATLKRSAVLQRLMRHVVADVRVMLLVLIQRQDLRVSVAVQLKPAVVLMIFVRPSWLRVIMK